jgi:phage terminase small subunit
MSDYNGLQIEHTGKTITERQRRFAEEYVFGKLQPTLAGYAQMFEVSESSISNWLANPQIKSYIHELRQQRQDMIQGLIGDKIELAVNEIAQVASIDAQRIVNKGRKNEHRVYDPMLLDRKLRAAQAIIEFGQGGMGGDVEAAAAKGGINVNINNMQGQSQKAAANEPTLEEIEQLLRERDVLNRNERIIEAPADDEKRKE